MRDINKNIIEVSKAALIVLIILTFQLASAQDQKRVMGRAFELTWSNDFVSQTDRYFSNGLDLSFTHPFMQKSPIRFLLLPDKWASKVYHSLTLSQHFFTPDQLFVEDINNNDRPYASYLLLGHQKIAMNAKRRIKLQTEFQAGIFGKYSGGETVQNGIHELLPASQSALGWGNQLSSDLALNYSLRIEKGLISNRYFDLIPHAGTRLGIPYTDFEGGILLRIGKFPNYFENPGWLESKGISYFLFADFSGKYVLYNATLEGGLINQSAYTIAEVQPLVSEIRVGLAFGVQNFTMEYSQYYLSPEFKNGLHHKWGAITFRVAF